MGRSGTSQNMAFPASPMQFRAPKIGFLGTPSPGTTNDFGSTTLGPTWGVFGSSARPVLNRRCIVCRLRYRALVVCADPNNLPFSNRAGEGFENKIVALLARDMDAAIPSLWWPQGSGLVRKTLNAARCDLWPGVVSGLDTVPVTERYYRSTYVFVSRRKAPLRQLTR